MNRFPETLADRRSPRLEGVGRVKAVACWAGKTGGVGHPQIGAIRGGLTAKGGRACVCMWGCEVVFPSRAVLTQPHGTL